MESNVNEQIEVKDDHDTSIPTQIQESFDKTIKKFDAIHEEVTEEDNEDSNGVERVVSLDYGLTEGLIHSNEPIIKSMIEAEELASKSQSKGLPQINITHEDTDQVIETYSNANDNSFAANDTKFATLDPSYCETSSSKAYQMRRDSIRLSLQSSNIDLGNAIEVNNVSFGYAKNMSVLTNISINVPKG